MVNFDSRLILLLVLRSRWRLCHDTSTKQKGNRKERTEITQIEVPILFTIYGFTWIHTLMWDQEQYLQTFKDRLTDPIEDSIIAMVSLLPILALKGTKALSKGSWAG